MTIYQYAVVEKPEAELRVCDRNNIDMENLDYKRQPDACVVERQITLTGGMACGIFRGGMFGLATNRLAILSAWEHEDAAADCAADLVTATDYLIPGQETFLATVRPSAPEKITRDGFYVIRWIRMFTSDIEEYTQLCLETWPAFETDGTARCYGVFRPLQDEEISKLLMLTWYASLGDWEKTRNLAPADEPKWARRSEMELSHWAEGARLATR